MDLYASCVGNYHACINLKFLNFENTPQKIERKIEGKTKNSAHQNDIN
jgi:hypothetical protein